MQSNTDTKDDDDPYNDLSVPEKDIENENLWNQVKQYDWVLIM